MEREPDLLWALSQLLLSWLSYLQTRFFCQLTALWIFCFSLMEAPCYCLLPTPGCSQKTIVLILYVRLRTPVPFLKPGQRPSLVGVEEEPPWGGDVAWSHLEQLHLCFGSRGMFWSTRDHIQVFHSNLMTSFLWDRERLERHKNSHN